VAGVPIMVGWRNGYELNVLRMYQSATAVHPISHKPTSGPWIPALARREILHQWRSIVLELGSAVRRRNVHESSGCAPEKTNISNWHLGPLELERTPWNLLRRTAASTALRNNLNW